MILIIAGIILIMVLAYHITPKRIEEKIHVLGNDYVVKLEETKNKENLEETRKLFEEIIKRCMILKKYLKDKYKIKEAEKEQMHPLHEVDVGVKDEKIVNVDPVLYRNIMRFLKGFNPNHMQELSPFNSDGDSAFTEHKDIISLCVRDKNGNLHNLNEAVFVVLHEISHIVNVSQGHKSDFWKCFRFILQEAVEAGIYHPIDYQHHITTYCGTRISYNPLFNKIPSDN